MNSLSKEAINNIQLWLTGPYDVSTKESINTLMHANPEEAENAFYTHLSFGTGGMRGLMGVGPNRMNIYTIRQTTKGLANYLKKLKPKDHLKVVIGYDSRRNSRLFAIEAARVLAASSIEVFVFKELRPTPLVSFACRHLQCNAAIMITASHNPAEYNGYKVYWSEGGQVLPPHDTGIMAEVAAVCKTQTPIHVTEEDDPFIHVLGKDIDDAYLVAIQPYLLWPHIPKKELSLVYSCLHGTGGTLMPRALTQTGIVNVQYVKEQMVPDGAFPTTRYPNPEEKEALKLGIDLLMTGQHDIFLATDPDADRLGVVVRHNGEARILTGNQIASIAAEWIFTRLTETASLPRNPAIVKTIVTSPLLKKIAEKWNASCFDVLTGFKYIAEKMNEWEKHPEKQTFIFGCEESYGYLYGTHARDKDAIASGCLIAEIAWHFKTQGKTLIDALEDIWKRYGYFEESMTTCSFSETKEGRDRMAEVMKTLRDKPPEKFGKYSCIAFEDLEKKEFRGDSSCKVGGSLPQSDVLLFTLQDFSKIIVRPSGTEPKVKVYFMVTASDSANNVNEAKTTAKNKCDQLKLVIKEMVS